MTAAPVGATAATGKVAAVVTGGASGIGRSIARRLFADGYEVAILDCQEAAPLEPAVGEGRRAAFSIRTDVADEAAVQSAFGALSGRLEGRLSLLVNSAGVFPRQHAAAISPAEWRRVVEVNLTGSFLCAQAFHEAVTVTPHAGASIVMLGSPLARKGAPEGAHYSASKAGLLGLTRSLATAWAPRIRVNMVVPGMTDTAQLRQGGFDAAAREAAVAGIPMGRLCEGADVASVVAFLASSEAGYITGQALWVNGGALSG